MSELVENVSELPENVAGQATYSTAFVVLISKEGNPTIVVDLDPSLWSMDHRPTLREVRRAVLEIASDFQTQAVLEGLVNLLSKQEAPTQSEVMAEALAKRSS
jgi:HEAT repeat protein